MSLVSVAHELARAVKLQPQFVCGKVGRLSAFDRCITHAVWPYHRHRQAV